MPITISYDLRTDDTNQRTYVRSMLERFHWRRLGGSVFRYEGVRQEDGTLYEDWLNHVAPSLMFLRSFLLSHGIRLRFLTVDASSISFLDHSDRDFPLGTAPQNGPQINLADPTNPQSSEIRISEFVDAATAATQ
jgi:hypothetical protein